MTHLGSGWRKLYNFLNTHPKIMCFSTGATYDYFDCINTNLTIHKHKLGNASAVWGDVILHNKDFTCPILSKKAVFIYWVTPFQECDRELPIDKDWAMPYYQNRLFGLTAYRKRTPKAVWNPELDYAAVETLLWGNQ